MNDSQKRALLQIKSVINERYSSMIKFDTRRQIANSVNRKCNRNDVSGALADIEKLVLISVKDEGKLHLLEQVKNIEGQTPSASASIQFLFEVQNIDKSGRIKKVMKAFKKEKNWEQSIPHPDKVLFGVEEIFPQDIIKYREMIISECQIPPEFFNHAIGSNPSYAAYLYVPSTMPYNQAPFNPTPYPNAYPAPDQYWPQNIPHPYSQMSIQPPFPQPCPMYQQPVQDPSIPQQYQHPGTPQLYQDPITLQQYPNPAVLPQSNTPGTQSIFGIPPYPPPPCSFTPPPPTNSSDQPYY